MADEKEAAPEGGEDAAAGAAPKKKLDMQFLLVVANATLMVLALVAVVYVKLLYHPPSLRETTELTKDAASIAKPQQPSPDIIVSFPEMTVNIATTSGKAHYATVAISLKCLDQRAATLARAQKAILLDRVVFALGKREITELNTVQGRMLLKTELLRDFNDILPGGSILDIYFPTFIMQ